MKKVFSIIAMLIFVAGFTMAQNPTSNKANKPKTKTEAKADTTKKSHKTMHHTGKKGTTKKSTTTKKTSTSTTTN